MDKLIEKINSISSLSEIVGLESVDSNDILCAIIKSGNYQLLEGQNIHFNPSNKESFGNLAELILSNEDYMYDLRQNGFVLSSSDASALFSVVKEQGYTSSQFHTFFSLFYNIEGLLNNLILDNREYFREYLRNTDNVYIEHSLKTADAFITLILEEKKLGLIDLTNYSQNYSAENLKLLASTLDSVDKLPTNLEYCGPQVPLRFFELKDQFSADEFYKLLTVLKNKNTYDRAVRGSTETVFTTLVKENFDYLINMMEGREYLPKCLIESPEFRDECIARNRFDLASQCVLPENIMDDENVVAGYCQALNISDTMFYSRIKWVEGYHKINNNVFNSILGTSFKNNIFNVDKSHFERFINDVEIQQGLAKLSEAELKLISKILDKYSFKDYDVSMMITNIIGNIKSYGELINSIDADNINDEQLALFVSVVQNQHNPYNINTINELKNYTTIKMQYFVDNFNDSSLDINKSNLLQSVFNIDFKEARYIYSKFCHDSQMLENLKESELPKENLTQLLLIDKIVNCSSQEDLAMIYNQIKDMQVYSSELPLETHLKAVYSNLYSQSIYSPLEREQVYGPKEHVMTEEEYHGQNVQICVPRANFNFLVHVVGTCSVASDNTSSNYKEDWVGRPQMQDHFVCCSYISEKEVFSLRDGNSGSIIMGFDELENGSLLAMGNNDIDSTGISKDYNGARVVEELNQGRARYFVPTELSKATIAKGSGYNEIVIERRDESLEDRGINKRTPSYIVMTADSLSKENFSRLGDVYQNQLPFLSQEDILELEKVGSDKTKISQVLVKYKDIISTQANEQNIELKTLAYHYIDLIIKGKYYEECLKAASEFDVPLVVVDREYYFKKTLSESLEYSEEMKSRIFDFYTGLNASKKPKLFNMIVQGKDISDLLPPPDYSIDN